MNDEWLALVEEDGRAYLLQRGSGEVRVRGLGRFNVDEAIGKVSAVSYTHLTLPTNDRV